VTSSAWGGDSIPISISGSFVWYAGGGSSGMYQSGTNTINAAPGGFNSGGTGGSKTSAGQTYSAATAGLNFTGGGGGGGADNLAGGAGGSGIVIVRYKL
jgi:hypothetical protein